MTYLLVLPLRSNFGMCHYRFPNCELERMTKTRLCDWRQ